MGKVAAVASILSSVVGAIGGMKQMTQKTPSAPEPSKPTVMPTEDSAMVADARRRALMAQQNRGGRTSTFLTDTDNETFGG